MHLGFNHLSIKLSFPQMKIPHLQWGFCFCRETILKEMKKIGRAVRLDQIWWVCRKKMLYCDWIAQEIKFNRIGILKVQLTTQFSSSSFLIEGLPSWVSIKNQDLVWIFDPERNNYERMETEKKDFLSIREKHCIFDTSICCGSEN